MNSHRRRDPLGGASGGYPQEPRLRAGTVVLLTLVLSGAAAISGYSGWSYWVTQRKLRATEAELNKLAVDHRRVQADALRLDKGRGELETQLAQGKTRTTDLEAQLTATSERLSELEANRAETDARLAEFRRITQQFQNMVDSGRLEVVFRRGRMTVALPAQVLFPSGSAKLTEDGNKALREVAAILHGVNDRRFIVAGHTDNVPVSTAEFADNWQLSTARALRVTEALIGAGMRPSQLVAAGHAEFEPVATNKTPRGRQKNRRIEIVLEPHLRHLPGLDVEPSEPPKQVAKSPASSEAAQASPQALAAEVAPAKVEN